MNYDDLLNELAVHGHDISKLTKVEKFLMHKIEDLYEELQTLETAIYEHETMYST